MMKMAYKLSIGLGRANILLGQNGIEFTIYGQFEYTIWS
jgi:hypothetical protein